MYYSSKRQGFLVEFVLSSLFFVFRMMADLFLRRLLAKDMLSKSSRLSKDSINSTISSTLRKLNKSSFFNRYSSLRNPTPISVQMSRRAKGISLEVSLRTLSVVPQFREGRTVLVKLQGLQVLCKLSQGTCSFSALYALQDLVLRLLPSSHRGQSMAYSERQKSANKQLAKDTAKNRHSLFKKREDAAKKRAKERG